MIIIIAISLTQTSNRCLDKRSEERGFVFFTIFLSHSKNKFFDDFLQFHGRNIFNFPFLVTGVKIFLENFYVVQGFLLRVLVFKFFCKLFNFLVADGRKPAFAFDRRSFNQ